MIVFHLQKAFEKNSNCIHRIEPWRPVLECKAESDQVQNTESFIAGIFSEISSQLLIYRTVTKLFVCYYQKQDIPGEISYKVTECRLQE